MDPRHPRRFEKKMNGIGLAFFGFQRLAASGRSRSTPLYATLFLSPGMAPTVVQRRLGHKRIEITLGVCGRVLPSMPAGAAPWLAALLHG
jgi:hypothetical protein